MSCIGVVLHACVTLAYFSSLVRVAIECLPQLMLRMRLGRGAETIRCHRVPSPDTFTSDEGIHLGQSSPANIERWVTNPAATKFPPPLTLIFGAMRQCVRAVPSSLLPSTECQLLAEIHLEFSSPALPAENAHVVCRKFRYPTKSPALRTNISLPVCCTLPAPREVSVPPRRPITKTYLSVLDEATSEDLTYVHSTVRFASLQTSLHARSLRETRILQVARFAEGAMSKSAEDHRATDLH